MAKSKEQQHDDSAPTQSGGSGRRARSSSRQRMSDLMESLMVLLLAQSLAVPYHIYGDSRPPVLPQIVTDDVDEAGLRQLVELGCQFSAGDRTNVLLNADQLRSSLDPGDTWSHGILSKAIEYVGGGGWFEQQQVNPVITQTPRQPPHLANAHAQARAAYEETRTQNDMTLEDMDLIDVLWRRDIDTEKGVSAQQVAVPERQHERDLQLLTEKHFYRSSDDSPGAMLQQVSKAYKELVEAEQLYEKNTMFGAKCDDDMNVFMQHKESELNLASTGASGGTEPGENAHKFTAAEIEWQNEPSSFPETRECSTSISVEPNYLDLDGPTALTTNDVLLSEAASQDTTVAPMERPELETIVFDEFFPEGIDANADVNQLVTPTLMLDTNDINTLFADQQFSRDVAAAATDLSDQPSTSTWTAPPLATHDSPEDEFLMGGSSGELGQSSVLAGKHMYQANTNRYRVLPTAPVPHMSPGRPESAEQRRVSTCESTGSSGHSQHAQQQYNTPVSDAVASYPYETETVYPMMEDSHEYRLVGKLLPGEVDVVGDDDDDEEDIKDIKPSFMVSRSSPQQPGSSSSSSSKGRKCKDEQLAAECRLPFTAAQLVQMGVNEFKAICDSHPDRRQVELMKKLRRRGKNKAAAAVCRQRKWEQKSNLEVETALLEQEFQVEIRNHDQLNAELAKLDKEIAELEEQVEEQ